jgi:hypothetical protein
MLTVRRLRVNIISVEKQQELHILTVCLQPWLSGMQSTRVSCVLIYVLSDYAVLFYGSCSGSKTFATNFT